MKGRKTRFSYDKSDPMYRLLAEELYEAHSKGYSVVELAQVLNHTACRGLYNLMRDEGIVTKMVKGRRRRLETHPGFLKALERTELSFAQWVNSHGLAPEVTAKALMGPVNPSDPASVAAHAAVRQDFRFLYGKLYGEEIPPSRPEQAEGRSSKYSLTIEFAEEHNCFQAFVHGLPVCRAVGKTREAAFYALRDKYVLFHSVRKLKLLPPKPTPQAA